MTKILVYVQHLLGTGHLHRTALITTALANNDFEVTVVSGGMPESEINFGNIQLVQLAAVKTDPDFTDLYDQDGRVIDDEFKQTRCRQLIATYNKIKPDVVLIETYPFGRRQMRFELLPLLTETDLSVPKPLVVCSIRDVIQPKTKQKRIDEIVGLIDRYFDAILVHGDKSFIEFGRTFPDAYQFADKLYYSGYVTKATPKPKISSRQNNTVLVSAGGGAVGQKLYQVAAKAAQCSLGRSYKWHVLVGNNISEKEFKHIAEHQSDNLLVERNRSDFLELLTNCSISVSQAGYNTIMDILVTATTAIVVPFEGQAEQEQLIRAFELEKSGLLTILREKHLSIDSLLNAISNVNLALDCSQLSIEIDGAAQTAAWIQKKLLIKTNN